MQRLVFIFILFSTLTGCSGRQNQNTDRIKSNNYAQGFRLIRNENITKLSVFNPWEKAENISVDYYLHPKGSLLPDSLSNQKVIKTPVKRVVCLSTTHIAFLNELDEINSIVGISGSQYVSNPKLRKRIEAGEVPDVGYGQNLNYEQIVSQQPDLVMVYGVGSEVTSFTQKLEEMGIPVILIAEYLEENPLGKAEWIKFIGALFEKEKKASTFFSQVEEEYLELKQLAAGETNQPKVLVGSPYNDTWWVPGGNSYMANLIADAGGDYLGKDNQSNESFAISFENALVWGSQADVWINMGNLSSKKEIRTADDRFKNFRVFNEGRIYNNIKRLSPHGGNDFWESGTVNPQLVLRDLIHIFHPNLIQEEMIYYSEIK
ncbi:iron complex transport system substrate-binding protein [Tangfeifania diversioriginum]|uniref:Iron complex transport system substrate-binding protein n=1 Tax=Tangfeifania diversioriginum TaxID=1168035 RepID=A0A1M6NZ50_9BACT|nr:ABC transporter substrate-binding protein [Tangfeifania diversioriginum]SHK00928.1 iron complex transport system substrate-binding protein [Tangfeifania diversioriginum]